MLHHIFPYLLSLTFFCSLPSPVLAGDTYSRTPSDSVYIVEHVPEFDCEIDNSYTGSNPQLELFSFSGLLGQTFTPCESGVIQTVRVLALSQSFIFSPNTSETSGGHNIKFFSGASVDNGDQLASMSNVTLVNTQTSPSNFVPDPTKWSEIDVSGLNLEVTSGQTYTFLLGGNVALYRSQSDSYGGGQAYLDFFEFSPTTDLYFQIEISAGDSDPPVVQSTAPNGSPSATASSVDFTVTFDESASNVSTDDFQLTTTGSASGNISGISGAGTSYSVTVNSIAGAGTLRLDLKSSTNITDGTNGNGTNGYVAAFTSGTAHTVDNPPTVTLSSINNSLSESATGTTGVITATLSHSYTSTVTVNLATSGATSGSDFSISTTAITITSGNTTGEAIITILDDDVVEGTETLTVEISSVTNGSESGSQSEDFTIANNDFTFNIKVFLEGPLSGSSMGTGINANLPTTQPYGNATSETSSGIPADAVDWVEVELRTGTTAGTKVGTNRAAILTSSGLLEDKDGNALTLSQADGTAYYIVIHHRNHLSIMSASAVSESNGVYDIDFTDLQNKAFNSGTTQAGSVFAMPSGDIDNDGDIDADDLSAWRTSNGAAFAYSTSGKSDLNLDGVINAIDRNLYWKNNTSKTSQVPTT